MHRDAAVGIGEVHLSRVDPHPNLDCRVLGPRLGGQGALSLDRGRDGITRAGEDDEESVTGSFDLGAAVSGERVAKNPVVSFEDGLEAIAERARESRRSLDVREQEGHGTLGRCHRSQ